MKVGNACIPPELARICSGCRMPLATILHRPDGGVIARCRAFTLDRRPPTKMQFDRDESMRAFIVGFWLASTLSAGVAVAQQAPFNEAGVAMGHWHLVSHDVAANKKIFAAM